MPYVLKYANLDSIQLKLSGRLKIDRSEFYPVEQVDTDLILIVAEEVEDSVDRYLEQVYVLPLRNRQPIVNNLVENLIMAKLIDYQYINNMGMGNDLSNFSTVCKKEAYNVLAKLVADIGIPIPEADAMGYYAQMNNRTSITLKGEIFTEDLPKTVTVNNFTYIGTITNDNNTVRDWLIEDKQYNNPFSMDYRG